MTSGLQAAQSAVLKKVASNGLNLGNPQSGSLRHAQLAETIKKIFVRLKLIERRWLKF
jgi:hypothetical protein